MQDSYGLGMVPRAGLSIFKLVLQLPIREP